ncbi:MAG: VOC family protein [Chloroflexota bacterium]
MAVAVQVVFDCSDPDSQAEFWSKALGYAVEPPPDGYDSWVDFLRANGMEQRIGSANAIVDPEGRGPRFYFQQVPEPKERKNRLHLDLNVSGGGDVTAEKRHARVAAEAKRLGEIGATQLTTMTNDDEHWVVMRDPEGNEFCLQ